MDEKSKGAGALLEIDYKNDGKSGSTICCSGNSSETMASSSRTNVTQCRVESSSKFTETDGNELRDEMITALAWATCRTFNYQPSDPIHYLAHQLLRWRHGDVSERISPEMINFSNNRDNHGRKNSSPSFCSDSEEICIGQSSGLESSSSQ